MTARRAPSGTDSLVIDLILRRMRANEANCALHVLERRRRGGAVAVHHPADRRQPQGDTRERLQDAVVQVARKPDPLFGRRRLAQLWLGSPRLTALKAFPSYRCHALTDDGSLCITDENETAFVHAAPPPAKASISH